jgi:hypothetical protein|tara:strand:- start:1068 stop:1229 length:162 start_codon:yes stop_codon:yes gene_type:complete
MDELDKDIDKMMKEIKKPTKQRWIFERAGDKVYKREFGAEPSTRVLINPEEVK